MKKRYIIFLLCIVVLSFVCVKLFIKKQNENKPIESKPFVTKHSDVINRLNSLENGERLKEFVNHVKLGEKDSVRVIGYTIEGDPIIDNVAFDGKTLEVKHDTKRDKYGEQKVETYQCKSIEVKQNTSKQDEYLLMGCFENEAPYHLATDYKKDK